MLDPFSLTIVLADHFSPDTMPQNTDRSCTCLIRYHGLTMEDLNYLILGPASEHGPNWHGLKAYGIEDLLIKGQEMGKRVYMMVLSGTKVVEGGPVSIVNSQQTLFSQFCNKGMYLKDLTSIIGFPAPLQHKEPHKRRDFPDEPMLSIVTDVRYKATMTASQKHCHMCTVPVSRPLMQRFTEAYHVSDIQEVVRQTQD